MAFLLQIFSEKCSCRKDIITKRVKAVFGTTGMNGLNGRCVFKPYAAGA